MAAAVELDRLVGGGGQVDTALGLAHRVPAVGVGRWLGLDHAGEFDPAAFDIEAVNRRLLAMPSPAFR